MVTFTKTKVTRRKGAKVNQRHRRCWIYMVLGLSQQIIYRTQIFPQNPIPMPPQINAVWPYNANSATTAASAWAGSAAWLIGRPITR